MRPFKVVSLSRDKASDIEGAVRRVFAVSEGVDAMTILLFKVARVCGDRANAVLSCNPTST